MKKLTVIVAITLIALCAPARAAGNAVEDALECHRTEIGLIPDAPLSAEKTYSAEVLVQEMQLRYLQDDRERFDALYALMKKHFRSRLMLLYRRLDAYLTPTECENSVRTDLRACALLMRAGEEWGRPEYTRDGLKAAGRIRKFNVYRDVITHGASWTENRSGIFRINRISHTLRLSDIDIGALQELRERLREWEEVTQRSLGILIAASSDGKAKSAYAIDRRRYEDGNGDATDELLIAYNLTLGGIVPLSTLEDITERLAAAPDLYTAGENASLRAAALAVATLHASGKEDMARALAGRVEKGLATDMGLLCEKGGTPSAYDNLLWLTVRQTIDGGK